jgi:hypothetical protein
MEKELLKLYEEFCGAVEEYCEQHGCYTEEDSLKENFGVFIRWVKQGRIIILSISI